jgi:molybdenum cofactor synthesis domain-containing protein
VERSDYQVAVITCSDKGAQGEREDRSGPKISEMLQEIGISVSQKWIVPDEEEEIAALLCRACDEFNLHLVITTGGTGLTPRDVTPQATKRVIDYEVPGIAEAMRYQGMKFTPKAMLSRAVVGVRGFTLIINLPGSEKAVSENLEILLPVLPHALDLLHGAKVDCGR